MSSYYNANGNFHSATLSGITPGVNSVFQDCFYRRDSTLTLGSTNVAMALSNTGIFNGNPYLRLGTEATPLVVVTASGNTSTGGNVGTGFRYLACWLQILDGAFHQLAVWAGGTKVNTSRAPATTALALNLFRVGQDFAANSHLRGWEEQPSIIQGLTSAEADAQVAARVNGVKIFTNGVFSSSSTTIEGTFVVGDDGKPIRLYGTTQTDIYDTVMTYVDATHATVPVAPSFSVASGGVYQIGKHNPLGHPSLPHEPLFSWDLRNNALARDGGVDLTPNGTISFDTVQVPFLETIPSVGSSSYYSCSSVF